VTNHAVMFANAGDSAGITLISRDLLDIIAHGLMLVIMNSLPGLTSAACSSPSSTQAPNPGRQASWPHATRAIGAEGLHFHDLRHTGNAWAASSGAALKDLMARMGHDSERAAIIYQHEARGADAAITSAIDAHVKSEQGKAADGLPSG
jgi:integrase